MTPKILRLIDQLPTTIKALIGFVCAVIAFVILMRANFGLGVITLSAVVAVAALSYLAHVALAKNKPGVGFSTKAVGGYKYPRSRGWAMAGLCAGVVICALLFVLRPTRYYILANLKGTIVAPRADILLAEFDARLASKKFEIPKRIEANLERELKKYSLSAKVATFPAPIMSQEEAKTAAEQSGAKVVVWGQYDDLGIMINIYTPTSPSSGDDALRLEEIAWAQGDDPLADISLKIRKRLPEDITFLSLFIIGLLNYQGNEYQNGYRAFDAAMSNLPKEISLENESPLHFFNARSLEAAGSGDAEHIICEYSKAIEINPNFAAAYNNLGILINDLYIAHKEKFGELDPPPFEFPGNSEQCLNKIKYVRGGLDDFFFDRALTLQPDSAILRYNKLASIWRVSTGHPLNGAEFFRELKDISEKDPSIAGAHVMLGIIAFDEGEEFTWQQDENSSSYPDVMRFAQTLNTGHFLDERRFEIATREFSAASILLPNSAEMHVNLGKVYVRKGMIPEARAEFEKALSLAPNSAEVRLSLADVAIRQGQPDLALKHLEAIHFDNDEDRGIFGIAGILKSRAHYELGNIAAAIEVLQNVLSSNEKGYWCCDASLVNYLIGLFYASSSDGSAAAEHWKKCDVVDLRKHSLDHEWWSARRDAAYHDNFTVDISWIDVLTFCSSGGRDVSEWGLRSQCLPRDVNQRLKKVFDITQDRIAYRVFYRQKAFFGALLCPYVFTHDADTGEWLFDTTILYGLDRKELEHSQSRALRRFDGKVIVREVEPETSYLDQISVVVTDRVGQSHILHAQPETLRSADGKYLILRQGDEIQLTFEGLEHIDGATHFRVEAKGYYVPDRGLRFKFARASIDNGH